MWSFCINAHLHMSVQSLTWQIHEGFKIGFKRSPYFNAVVNFEQAPVDPNAQIKPWNLHDWVTLLFFKEEDKGSIMLTQCHFIYKLEHFRAVKSIRGPWNYVCVTEIAFSPSFLLKTLPRPSPMNISSMSGSNNIKKKMQPWPDNKVGIAGGKEVLIASHWYFNKYKLAKA